MLLPLLATPELEGSGEFRGVRLAVGGLADLPACLLRVPSWSGESSGLSPAGYEGRKEASASHHANCKARQEKENVQTIQDICSAICLSADERASG